MSCLPRIAIIASSLLLLATAGCETTIIDEEGVGDDGFEDGDEAAGDGFDDGADDDVEDDDGSPTGSGISGSAASCEAAPVPDDAACDGAVSPLQLDQAQATTAIVGRWLRCNTEVEVLFPEGVVVFPEGHLKLLHQEDGQLVCREGFDEGGDWLIEDHCGIGMCDDYSMQLTWDGGSWSSMSLLFANDGDYLRIVNGAGDNEEFIRIP